MSIKIEPNVQYKRNLVVKKEKENLKDYELHQIHSIKNKYKHNLNRTMTKSEPIKLLIVDDNAIILSSWEQVLKDVKGVKLIGNCKDGSEVLSFLEANKVDVILMDMVMKKMNGF